EALTTALLYLDGVTVSFDGFKALNNLSLAVEPGEMRAIIGPNGAGKTTMMDVVTGKTRPDAGDVMFDGLHNLTRLDEAEIAELGIGRKFQKPTVFESHTVYDNIELALKSDRRARSALWWRETADEQEAAEAARILYVAMTRARDRLILSESVAEKNWSKQIRDFADAKNIEGFLKSGAKEFDLVTNGIPLVMRRAECEPGKGGGSDKPNAVDDLNQAAVQRALARLDFAPPPETELIASPTALADFERCPRQFMFRHQLGIPEGEVISAGGSDAAELGIVAHAVLERLGKRLGSPITEKEIRELVDAMSAGGSLEKSDRDAIARDVARYAAYRSNGGTRHDEQVIGREIPFFMSQSGGEFTVFVRGQIDLLSKDSRGLLVRDYKYSRAVQEAAAYDVQMQCYALAASESEPAESIRAELVFLRDKLETREIALPSTEEIRARILAIARAIVDARARDDFPKKPEDAGECRKLRCGYIARCWHATA
ncbi:MAG TPA: PD-(D/E)XK nuclease family protein, partial [Candidatus Binataceae bacterium]